MSKLCDGDRGGFGGVGCGMFHYSTPQMPGSMPAGPFGCTCGSYMPEDEYYDSSDPEPTEGPHRYVRENYHAHEGAARRTEVHPQMACCSVL